MSFPRARRRVTALPGQIVINVSTKETTVLAVAQRVLKALAAAVSAGLASYGVAVADGTVAGDEWITLVVAAIGAGLVVWAVPNKPA